MNEKIIAQVLTGDIPDISSYNIGSEWWGSMSSNRSDFDENTLYWNTFDYISGEVGDLVKGMLITDGYLIITRIFKNQTMTCWELIRYKSLEEKNESNRIH